MDIHNKRGLFVAYILLIMDVASYIPSILYWGADVPATVIHFIYTTQPFHALMNIRTFQLFVYGPLIMHTLDVAISVYCIRQALKACPRTEVKKKIRFKEILLLLLGTINILFTIIIMPNFTPWP
jgi:hypothetical protein